MKGILHCLSRDGERFGLHISANPSSVTGFSSCPLTNAT